MNFENELTFVRKGRDLFIEMGGERIAKRGRPGTPDAGTWISLKPGVRIKAQTDLDLGDTIEVEFTPMH